MPSYINRLIQFGTNGGYGCCESRSAPKEDSCQSSLNFFTKLTEKMVIMVKSLKQQFEECRKQITTKAKGFLLAEVEVKTAPLNVKYEYIEYIKRYGPPTNGVFDEDKLKKLRTELGLDTQTSL
jgi:hypothetical protein